MLYRTHRPILFSSSFFFTSLSSTSHHSHKKMERVEGPLKSNSFSPDMSLKTTPSSYPHQNQPHALFHDSSAVNNLQNAAVLGDDFFVDELLDFSNAVVEDPDDHMPQESLGNDVTTVTKAATYNVTSVTTFSVKDDDFGTLPASELSVPADDLESLEWLSNFVDDSCASYSLTCCPVIKLVPEPAKVKTEPEVLVQTKPCFTTPVQTKARSKRSRAGLPGWSLGSYSLSESSSSSTSSISTTTSSSSPTSLYYSSLPGQAHTAVALYGKQPVKKKHKKRPITTESSGGGGGGGHQQARRCSHCGVQKTPQWRAGPLGAKTLCNACGVRFKSGRLLPEYRPACSPTFSSELHSNNHRKVLEMRRQKEMEDTGLAGFAPPVQSF